MTTRAAGRAARAIRLAGLALLLAAVVGLLGLPGAGEVAAQGTRDYDRDGDRLIEVRNLAELDAIRYDLNGDGLKGTTSDEDWAKYQDAFRNAMPGMGCDSGCAGYELLNDLDFDENGDGTMSAGGDPTYWNDGAGWLPIGQDPGYARDTGSYAAIFEGNGNTISNLYINRHITNNVRYTGVGLFGISGGQLRNVGLENPYISVTRSGTRGYYRSPFTYANFTDVGALIGSLSGSGATISGSWVNGGGVAFTQGEGERSDATAGCLAGVILPAYNQTTENPANYATCAVYAHSTLSRTWEQANAGNRDRNIARVGGLAGSFNWGHAIASYARGNVTCRGNGYKSCGGLFGEASNGNIVSSYATGNVVNEAFSPPRIVNSQCENTYALMRSGGLTTHSNGNIIDSYSTGRVTAAMATPAPCTDGRLAARLVGGLGVKTGSGSITNSYWDAESSGIDYNDRGGAGHTTARLTNPTGYADIYANWNRDLDGGGSDDPWDFGTGAQYPILTWRHDVLSQRRQRAPQPTVTEYTLPPEPNPEPGEYVAPPIVYNLNIRFNVKGLTLDEGESATYRVRMSQPPVGHPARVAITSNNPDVVVAPNEVTFSSADYNQWQTVKVSTLRDPNDTDESATLAHRGPNLSYGSILVMVNDIWPGTTTETVNGHTLTLHHAADAPAGVTITAPETLDADADVTVAAAPSHTPLSAPGYGLGAETAARMLVSIRVNGAPSDGLSICLAVPAALVTEAGERPLTLLRYADGVWKPVAGAERREGDNDAVMLCAAGVTEYGVFAAAYAIPDALGVAADLAAATSGPGRIVLTWTPAANATVHFVFAIKKSDAEARNFDNLAAWGFTDRANAHTVSNLESGAPLLLHHNRRPRPPQRQRRMGRLDAAANRNPQLAGLGSPGRPAAGLG